MTASLSALTASPAVAHGAPGVSVEVPVGPPGLTGVRRDLAAFVGVAPRGPARRPVRPLEVDEDVRDHLVDVPVQRSVAVAVSTWTEYRRLFGGFEGPGRLPYAVSAFFAQGGERARVVRIVHAYGDDLDGGGRAAGVLVHRPPAGAPVAVTTRTADVIGVSARDEGTWGDRVRARLRFDTRPLVTTAVAVGTVEVGAAEWVPIGSLLRATDADGVQELRYVDDSTVVPWPDRPGGRRVVRLDVPLTALPSRVEVVTATLLVVDDDPTFARTESLADLGLSADHPRWLARVLVDESDLLWPDPQWASGRLALTDPMLPDLELADLTVSPPRAHLGGGVDRTDDITPEDFFDDRWVPGDETPGAGVQCLAEHDDVGLLVVPDLYDPAPLREHDDVGDPAIGGGPTFAPCVEVAATTVAPPATSLGGLRLDPMLPADLARIVALQQRLVAEVERDAAATVLLDVPPGLTTTLALRWRAGFDSAHAAAYHPWLDVATPDDARDALVRVPPSAFAAGVVAARERLDGVAAGPANRVVTQAVRAAVTVAREDHDRLHDEGIDVFVARRDGITLTGARTLSRDRRLRQLSVARLMTVLRLTLERELAWLVFEPADVALRGLVRRSVSDLLERWHRAGALAGRTPQESFFVACDDATTTRDDVDHGRLVALVGVAPATPTEYLRVRLVVDGEVTARVEVDRG